MAPLKWYHAAIIGGGVVGLSTLLYYLMREDNNESNEENLPKKNENTKTTEKFDVRTATKAQVENVLQKIMESQEKMKAVMKDLSAELARTNYTFDEVYQKVKAIQPEDPLEATGITMGEFDQLLEKYQNEPSVRDFIGKIMGPPGPVGISERIGSIKREQIVEIHQFMLAKLQELVRVFNALPNKDNYDMKTVTIAAQAIVATQVEQKYSLNSEEIEAGVLLHHQALATDAEFARINVQMQTTMSDLMGSHFPSQFF